MPKSQSTIRVLEKYATWLFATLIILLSIVLLYIATIVTSPYKDICLAVATSLLASILFSFSYSFIAERHHINAINEEIEKDITHSFHSMHESYKQEMEQLINTTLKNLEEMKDMQQVSLDNVATRTVGEIQSLEESHYHQITSHFRALIPSDHFPATDQPDKRFNHVLTDALKHSRQYLFRGITARYVPSRLEATEHHNLTCQILLIDPTRDDLLKLYVQDRFGSHLTDQEIHNAIQSVKQEIYMTIIDLFSQARRTTIDIRMH